MTHPEPPEGTDGASTDRRGRGAAGELPSDGVRRYGEKPAQGRQRAQVVAAVEEDAEDGGHRQAPPDGLVHEAIDRGRVMVRDDLRQVEVGRHVRVE